MLLLQSVAQTGEWAAHCKCQDLLFKYRSCRDCHFIASGNTSCYKHCLLSKRLSKLSIVTSTFRLSILSIVAQQAAGGP